MCVQRGLLFALFALFSTDALAQAISLPEIVVPAGSADAPPLPAGSGQRSPPAAASELVVTRQEVLSQPVMRPGEILEQAPGLIVTQHSGEGKANQYFLRGFNLDHGTDLALTVAGMPINMPTHGHGQGYADINFLIPELVQSMLVRKGPYFADKGDFSTAGAIDIDYIDKINKNLAQLTVGSFGYKRGLGIASTSVGTGTVLGAIEATAYNGPWATPDDVRKFNGVLRYSNGTATDGFSVTAMAYSNKWNSTDQVAQRAVNEGLIDRFGTLNPTDGGTSSRYSLSGRWSQSTENTVTTVNAFAIRSTLQLWNDFTYFLDDPVNGDQFSQTDKRTIGGFDAQTYHQKFDGADTRRNDIRRPDPIRRHSCWAFQYCAAPDDKHSQQRPCAGRKRGGLRPAGRAMDGLDADNRRTSIRSVPRES